MFEGVTEHAQRRRPEPSTCPKASLFASSSFFPPPAFFPSSSSPTLVTAGNDDDSPLSSMPTVVPPCATMSTPCPGQVLSSRRPPVPSSSRRSTRLPPELIDLIIDYLHLDKPTLQHFALASRRWLRSVRYHLFHHVRVLASPDDSSRAFGPFIHFLETHPHLGHYIREVELCGNSSRRHDLDSFAELDGEQLIPIVRRLPFLHTLILSQVYVVPPSATGSWTEFTMQLRKLVWNEIYSDCEGAQWLATIFKVYDTLHILDPIPVLTETSPALMNMPADSFNLLEHVRSLVIESRNDPMSLGKIEGLMPFIMKKVASLELLLELEEKQQVGRLEAFIKSKGESVKHLRLDIDDVQIFQKQSASLMRSGVNLTVVCPQLQSLHLCLHSSYPTEVTNDHWGYGTAVLADGPRSLRRLTIGMVTSEDNPYTMDLEIDWSQFERALLSLKDLECVRFQMEGERDGWRTTAECAQPLEDCWREYLQERLPALRARGIMRFLE
ncbi:hypothetical protein EIP91_010285 [Steccherinum ochraceum]|uniref:F-box domain-containing protein n=1 Tax=Steccherinum ochraceum TaxID=92696 RepID=A0A4R0RJ39_9APHY|nr:hypothetical protein EIP91_010285 [Steccherinum ochraceum]